jgi:hypothetical protein
LFEKCSNAVHWIVENKLGIQCCVHVLDDFLFISPPVIDTDSSSTPKNVNFVVGKTVCSCLIGMSSFSAKIKKQVRSDDLVHVSITKESHPD